MQTSAPRDVRLEELQYLLTGTYFDGLCATRREGSSQGGYVQCVVTRSAAESEAPLSLLVIDMKIDTTFSEASFNVAKLIFVCELLHRVSLHVARICDNRCGARHHRCEDVF